MGLDRINDFFLLIYEDNINFWSWLVFILIYMVDYIIYTGILCLCLCLYLDLYLINVNKIIIKGIQKPTIHVIQFIKNK